MVVGGDFGLRFPRHCHCLLLLEYRDKDGYRENFTTVIRMLIFNNQKINF